MTTRADVIAEARTWIGTPWHHLASCKGAGADCARGLIVGVARELGLPEAAEFEACVELRAYGRDPNPDVAIAACRRFLDEVDQPQPGDILYLRVPRIERPMHFAILSAPNRIIHAVADKKVVEHRMSADMRARIVLAFSYRGLAC